MYRDQHGTAAVILANDGAAGRPCLVTSWLIQHSHGTDPRLAGFTGFPPARYFAITIYTVPQLSRTMVCTAKYMIRFLHLESATCVQTLVFSFLYRVSYRTHPIFKHDQQRATTTSLLGSLYFERHNTAQLLKGGARAGRAGGSFKLLSSCGVLLADPEAGVEHAAPLCTPVGACVNVDALHGWMDACMQHTGLT